MGPQSRPASNIESMLSSWQHCSPVTHIHHPTSSPGPSMSMSGLNDSLPPASRRAQSQQPSRNPLPLHKDQSIPHKLDSLARDHGEVPILQRKIQDFIAGAQHHNNLFQHNTSIHSLDADEQDYVKLWRQQAPYWILWELEREHEILLIRCKDEARGRYFVESKELALRVGEASRELTGGDGNSIEEEDFDPEYLRVQSEKMKMRIDALEAYTKFVGLAWEQRGELEAEKQWKEQRNQRVNEKLALLVADGMEYSKEEIKVFLIENL